MARRSTRRSRACVLLAVLLYGHHNSVQWWGLAARVHSPTMAKTMSCNTTRLRAMCQWLESQHYLDQVRITRGYIYIRLATPLRFAKAWEHCKWLSKVDQGAILDAPEVWGYTLAKAQAAVA